jgi:allantoate deiminase
MTAPQATLGLAAMERLQALAGFSDEPDRLTRLYLSPSYVAASDRLRGWMEEAGMRTRVDAVGNVIGRYGDATGPALVLGSHFDTVRNAGWYDGNLGVIAAIAAVGFFHTKGDTFPFPIDVIAFGDEEGVRFPTTMTGSRALAGLVAPDDLDKRDGDGVSVREALASAGLDPDALATCVRAASDIAAYLEVHIEQGPVLERENRPLGIVTGIAGATRARVEVTGIAGHAGTVPMAMRHDALACAAEMILAVETVAHEKPKLVATVGVVDVRPKAANVIPGFAGFSLDVRSEKDVVREEGLAAIRAAFRAICERRHMGFHIDIAHSANAVQCDARLMDLCDEAVRRVGVAPRRLVSGAGHDAMIMARLAPVGMIFVRCRGGISHNPLESISPEDADFAVRALIEAVRAFRP